MMLRIWMFLVAGCTGAGAPAVEPVARCSMLLCGGNSPQVDHYRFHDLNLDHRKNAAGFELVGLTKDGLGYGVEVRNGVIVGVAPGNYLKSDKLTGAQIWLRRDSNVYAIEIESVRETASVVPPYDAVESYVLVWSVALGSSIIINPGGPVEIPLLSGDRSLVCAGSDLEKEYGLGPEYWTELEYQSDPVARALRWPYESIVFEGDRIDANRKTVDPVADDRWFNIGCGRHALAKLRLTRSTLHTSPSGAWQQVQATLKMLSADYCGTGTPFTVPGQPLVWRNEEGMKYWQTPHAIEARWNENGAICLDTPRVLASSHPLANAMFPDVERDIAATCPRPPPCPSSNPDRFDSADERVTTGLY